MKILNRREDEVVLSLSTEDLVLIIAGLRETLEELEDWEFETRTGFQRHEMSQFLDEMLAVATRQQYGSSDDVP